MSETAEYLVHIQVNWPPDGDPVRRDELMAAERARGRELVEAGVIRRLWRVPGRWANWGVWRAASTDDLHGRPGLAAVLPLARHPGHPPRRPPQRPRLADG